MKKIAILGSTGSIGTQALDVIAQNPDHFQVSALACGKNLELLRHQIEIFHPSLVAVKEQENAKTLKKAYPNIEVFTGAEGLISAATCDCDMVLNALVGIEGLMPTWHGIKAGKDIALANKETLVAGGELIMKAVSEAGVRLLPVDSEHSAIFQCLQGNSVKEVQRILLTASGGPFRGYSIAELEKVSLEQALHHPRWIMGSKITIDSATMMNKGLEVIEAKWLFDIPLDQIEVVVHPQSIVHSAVEYWDGSVMAQMGRPDMRVPISYAFGYPRRIESRLKQMSFFQEASNLTFEKPDETVFRCLKLAYDVSRRGGSYPVVLNGANETLVQLFLDGKIKFLDIQRKLAQILDEHVPADQLSLEEILQIDREARKAARIQN